MVERREPDPDSWHFVRGVFEQALELPMLERQRFVERETSGQLEIYREVMRLLDHWSEADDFLSPPRIGLLAERLGGWRPVQGERVGSYRIESLLGEGGMGAVYLAKQERPARAVALKLMHAGLQSAQAKRRFEFEAEVLGRLRHPGIAAIHEMNVHRGADGGEVPFFAMEYVEGARDLLRFADEERLDLRARIEIFRAVCDAVHHAHQKGVIHRDLKPGNILVDAAGRPKVIDYGVARAIDRSRVDAQWTQAGFVLGTLQYLSPEQLAGSPDDVDVQSDVYSLGVILYELTAGRPPYEVEGRPIAEMVATICRRMPPPPSAHRRGLSREIDWIMLCALSKERERRYGTAAELAEDLARFLRHEPLRAGPPGVLYRARKFVARNRLGVAAALLVLASLVGGIVALRVGLFEARAGRKDAETAQGIADEEAAKASAALRQKTAVLDALGGILAAVRPDEDGREVTLFELLERRRSELDTAFADDPEVRGALQDFLASAYYGLGLVDPAAELASTAIATLESLPKADPSQLARLRRLLSQLRVAQGALGEAQAVLDASARDLERAEHVTTSDELYAMRSNAILLEGRGEIPAAIEVYRELIPRAEQALDPADPLIPTAMAELAALLASMGEMEEAERSARLAHERALAHLGADSPYAVIVAMRLGGVLKERGKLAEAAPLLRTVVEDMTRVFGESHGNTIQALDALARTLALSGEVDEAEELAGRALDQVLQHHQGESSELEVMARMCLAHVLEARGETSALVEELEAAIQSLEDHGPANQPTLVELYRWRGEIELSHGRAASAEPLLRRAVELANAAYPAGNASRAAAHGRLGEALLASGRVEEAERELSASYPIVSASQDPALLVLAEQILDAWIGACAQLGRTEESARLEALRESRPSKATAPPLEASSHR